MTPSETRRSKGIDMRWHWVPMPYATAPTGNMAQGEYKLDYFTKNLPVKQHQLLVPFIVTEA
jgi:hypothetical protein